MASPNRYQLLPPLTEEEYQALKADIATRGVLVPIELDQDGAVLDGHHRLRACTELGITDYPRVVRHGLTEAEKAEHILALNLARRHLTREQRQELTLRLRGQGWSTPKIADTLKVNQSTVVRDLAGYASAYPALPSTITGADGKVYPAHRPEREPRTVPPALEAALAQRAAIGERLGADVPPAEQVLAGLPHALTQEQVNAGMLLVAVDHGRRLDRIEHVLEDYNRDAAEIAGWVRARFPEASPQHLATLLRGAALALEREPA